MCGAGKNQKSVSVAYCQTFSENELLETVCSDLFNLVDFVNTGLIMICLALLAYLKLEYSHVLSSYRDGKVDALKRRDITEP